MRINTSRLAGVSIGLMLTAQLFAAQHAAAAEPAEQFGAIKEFLLNTVEESQHHGAAATYALLQQNLAEFQRLKATVEQAAHIDEVIDELSSGLATIAGNFEQAAALRDVYKQHTTNSDRQLLQKRRQTQQAIAAINERIARVDAELKQSQKALPIARNATDRERHQITISANLSVLHSLNAQIEIWRRFENTQQRLATSLQLSAERTRSGLSSRRDHCATTPGCTSGPEQSTGTGRDRKLSVRPGCQLARCRSIGKRNRQ